MEFFNKAIDCLPDHWEKNDYKNVTYILVDLSEDSDEYIEIQLCCTCRVGGKIKNIKRIQHPFAYLRFKLREEFAEVWGEMRYEIRRVEEVGKAQVDDYIKYNCDDRRKSGFFLGNKSYVIKKLVSMTPERDSNRYPEYLVEVE